MATLEYTPCRQEGQLGGPFLIHEMEGDDDFERPLEVSTCGSEIQGG